MQGADDTNPAQIADISLSGMQLISRQRTPAKVGDFLKLEFMLPGTQKTIRNQVRVVRMVNEFTFGVRFIGLQPSERSSLRQAIAQYSAFAQPSFIRDFTNAAAFWVSEHRRGLLLSMTGIAIAVATGAVIFMTSDEHRGYELRSWGDYPKSWSTDYWSKDSYKKPEKPHSAEEL